MLNVEGTVHRIPQRARPKSSRPRRTSASRCPRASSSRCSGPSGCGKTTTLRSIAGLEKPARGRNRPSTAGVVYSSAQGIFVAPNKRNFGMVFQSYAIWPHMNVFQNAAFPAGGRQQAGSSRQRDREQGDARAARPWRSTISPTARRPSSPAASSSVWRWRARW